MTGEVSRPGEPHVADANMQLPDVARPAWQRPAFTSGNLAGVRSGVYSGRLQQPLAAALLDELKSSRPDADEDLLALLAITDARVLLAEQDLATRGTTGRAGNVRERLLKDQRSWIRLSLELRRELGATPLSAARLQRDQADAARSVVDIASVAAAGREARLRVERLEAEDREGEPS